MATQESAAGKTLVLHAPPSKFSGPGKTFEAMLSSGFAVGYILSDDAVAQLNPGCQVILLDKKSGKRAVGQLKELVEDKKAGNGHQRYNVYFENGKQVPYKPERLNRNGVALI